MADPITLGSLFAGLAGMLASGVAGNEAHRAYLNWLDQIQANPLDKETGLPRNHHIQAASRDALRAAAHLLALSIASQIDPQMPLVQRFLKVVREGQMGRVPILDADRDPTRDWVEALRRSLDEPGFDRWHDRELVFREDEIQHFFDGSNVSAAFGPMLTEKFVAWARASVQAGAEPPGFEAAVREGWQVGPNLLTLVQAYCLFFREFLKTRPEVARIYTVDLLSSVAVQVHNLPEKIDAYLEKELNPLHALVSGFRADFKDFAREFGAFREQQSSICAAIAALAGRTEESAAGAEREREEFRNALRAALDALKDLTVQLHPRLPLKRPGIPAPPRDGRQRSDLTLLEAKQRAIPLLGRETDFASLWSWLQSRERISARLLIGRAGAGKTRLAFELIWRVARELGDAWQAGRIDRTDLERFHAEHGWTTWEWNKPTLIVIDYAMAVVEPLTGLLRALCEKADADGAPLRLLLAEREANIEEGWFSQLLRLESSTAGPPVRELFDPPEPLRLAPLDTPEIRRLLLAEALRIVALRRGQPSPDLPPPGANSQFDQELNADTWSDPLYLVMAALVACEYSGTQVPTIVDLRAAFRLRRTDLAERVAAHEARRLAHFVGAEPHIDPGPLFLHLAAVATLRGGLLKAEASATVKEELNVLGRIWPQGHGHLVGLLEDALPGIETTIAPVQPDVVAEAFILARLGMDNGADSRKAAVRSVGHDPATVAVRFWHMVQSFHRHERHFRRIYDWINACITQGDIRDVHPLAIDVMRRGLARPSLDALRPNLATSLNHMVTKLLYKNNGVPKSDDLAVFLNNLDDLDTGLQDTPS